MIAALVALALGQYCQPSYGYGQSYGYGYQAKTYNYNYNQGYVDRLLFLPLATATAASATVTTPAVPAAPMPVPAPAASPQPDPTADRLDRIEALIAELAERQAQPVAPAPMLPAPPPSTPAPPPGIRRTPAYRPWPTPETGFDVQPEAVYSRPEPTPHAAEIPQAVLGSLKTYCYQCHGASSKGGFRMFAGGQLALSGDAIAAVFDQVESGAMPKYRTMPDAARNAILQWAGPYADADSAR